MRYVIIGASAAGISAAETLRKLDHTAEIVMISEDLNVYSRCMLHHYISGARDMQKLSFIDEDFFQKNNIIWIKGTKVISINENTKELILNIGFKMTYDKLLIASGASASIPPVKGLREGKNIFTLRDINDALNISKLGEKGKSVAVIGAGLVGLDAVMGLEERGVKISLMEMSNRILPMQLDKEAASLYENEMTKRGIQIYTSVKVISLSLDEQGNAYEVNLEDGRSIFCDFVVVAAGVKANTEFLQGSNVKVDREIVINERLETSVKDIYAAGDVCGTGIWPIAVKQGRYAAFNMVGKEEKIFDDYFAQKNTLNFFGIKTVSIGNVIEDSEDNVEVFRYNEIYKKIIHKDGIIKGILFQNDIDYCGVWTQVIKNKINISNINKNIFDLNFGDFYNINEKGQFYYKES